MEEEVFVEVEGYDPLDYTFVLWDGGIAMAEHGEMWDLPDNTSLLKRLHASRYPDDEEVIFRCCTTTIRGQFDKSTLEMGRARGTITVEIRGFYRNSGKRFSETIELPIELVEDLKDQQEKAPDKK